MTDDPREILKAAGVECAEVEAVYVYERDEPRFSWSVDAHNREAAILALARLVAKYKWQRDKFVYDYADDQSYSFEGLLDALDEEWEKLS